MITAAVLLQLGSLGFEQWHVAHAAGIPSAECSGLPSIVGCRIDGHLELEAIEVPLNLRQAGSAGSGGVAVSPPPARLSIQGFAPTVEIRPQPTDVQPLGTPLVLLASFGQEFVASPGAKIASAA